MTLPYKNGNTIFHFVGIEIYEIDYKYFVTMDLYNRFCILNRNFCEHNEQKSLTTEGSINSNYS